MAGFARCKTHEMRHVFSLHLSGVRSGLFGSHGDKLASNVQATLDQALEKNDHDRDGNNDQSQRNGGGPEEPERTDPEEEERPDLDPDPDPDPATYRTPESSDEKRCTDLDLDSVYDDEMLDYFLFKHP
ncbi:hypothetical protein BGZ79_005435 [Entomortierella chlamydospora]|nr:hypothetical protein BGZ79_005435 [Entomortierella chlamydospora]